MKQDHIAITELKLCAFRNYDTAHLKAPSPFMVLFGENGAGKTNILEALSFFAPGRGLRRAKLYEVGQVKTFNALEENRANPWAVSGFITHQDTKTHLGTGYDPQPLSSSFQEKRLIHIDDQEVKNQNELLDILTLNWLTPEMDKLFIEGSENRRRFLDRMVNSFDTAHSTRLSKYVTALKQRTKILQYPKPDLIWLDAIESEIAALGVAIAASRLDFIEKINHTLETSDSSFPKTHLNLSGLIETFLKNHSALATEDYFKDHLKNVRANVYEAIPPDGVHRTDLKALHVLKNTPASLCSTGEQKALLLSILLSHAKLQKKAKGISPILLFDEVVAHLDQNRRALLFEEIMSLNTQTWLTGTDAVLFKDLDRTQTSFVLVNKGQLSI